MTWTRCEVSWDLDFELFEKEWLAASGVGGCRCLTWRLFFGIGFDTVIHLCYSTQCSCAKIVHLDIETRVAEPHWSFMRFCWIWLLCFFCRCLLPGTWLGRIVKFIGIWILNLLKQWRAASGIGGVRCLASGTLLTQEFSSAVLGWYFISGFFTCSFGMAPSELNIFHPHVFQLQFCDGAVWTEHFSPRDFLPAVLRWHLKSWVFIRNFFTCSFRMGPC